MCQPYIESSTVHSDINHYQLLQTKCTEANATSLIPLDTIFLRNVLLSFVLAVLCGLKCGPWLDH